jgi:phage terminase large subunit-like protein
VIRHSRATPPQREFWASAAKFRLYVGGVGAGKTRAGCIQALRMPRGSAGTILAPTYPMLRDATLRTFLDLCDRGRIPCRFNKSEMVAEIGGRRTVFFRSADKPDRLRGPNLGWFWPDEAAMMPELVWKIMLGRLRKKPGLAWATTTPRGKDWLYKVFHEGQSTPTHHVTRASSRTNRFLPADFVEPARLLRQPVRGAGGRGRVPRRLASASSSPTGTWIGSPTWSGPTGPAARAG